MRKYLIWWSNLSDIQKKNYSINYFANINSESLTDLQIKIIYGYVEEEE